MRRIIGICMMLFIGWSLFAISLDESIALAKAGNRELLQAKEDIFKADATYKDVRGNLLPQLSLQGAYTLSTTHLPDSAIPPTFDFTSGLDATASDNDEYLAGALNGLMSSFIPAKTQREGSLAMQLKFQQVLFLGGKLINGIKAVDRYRSIQNLIYQVKERELIVSTTELFYQCLLAEKLAQVQQDALDTASRHLQRVENLNTEGLISEFDLMRARLEVAKLRPQVISSRNNYNLALEAFRRQIGTDDDSIIPTGEFGVPADSDISETEALENALNSRLELRLASINTEVNQIKYNAERGNYLPNVALSADYSLYTVADEFAIERDDFGTQYSIGIGFQIPLFTGLSNTSKRAVAYHSYRQAQLQERDYRDLIELEVKQNHQSLISAKRNLAVQNENIRMAERNLELAQYRFDNQVGIQLEVFDAQVTRSAIQLEYYNAIYQLVMANLKLKKSMGFEL
jgi:outer membrane protein TolC